MNVPLRAELAGESTLLMDLACLETFVRAVESSELLDHRAVLGYERVLHEGDFWKQQLFEVLSNIVSFEKIIVDKRAFYAFEDAERTITVLQKTGLSKDLSAEEFPIEGYLSAVDQVRELARCLWEHAPKSATKGRGHFLGNLLGYEQTRGVDDAPLKDMYDRHFFLKRPDFDFGDLPRNFAETGMSVERLFVYLEVARCLGVPAMIARSKYKALEEVGTRVGQAATRVVKARAKQLPLGTRTGLNEIQATLAGAALPRIKLAAPLLPAHIIRVAKAMQCSVWDAVMLIRNDEAAPAFRKYLWECRKALNPMYAGEHLRAKELHDDLVTIGKRVGQARSTSEIFSSGKSLTIQSSKIPVIGHLLQAFGVRDRIKLPPLPRRPPSYEIFMARWFG